MKTPFILAAFAAFLTLASAQSKIASIDMETVILSHPKEKANKEELTALLKGLEAKLAPARNAAANIAAEFEERMKVAGNDTLSEFVRREAFAKAQKLENDLRAKDKELREAAALAQQQIAKREHDLFTETMKDITSAIEAVAGAEKYDYVLDNSANRHGAPVPLVMYANPADDITDKVITALKGTRVDKKAIAEAEAKTE